MEEKVGEGTSLNWPVGVGGKGNEGVAGLVKQLPGAVGYVELIYALQNTHALCHSQEQERELDRALSRLHERGRAGGRSD